jgi:hypothetical protein
LPRAARTLREMRAVSVHSAVILATVAVVAAVAPSSAHAAALHAETGHGLRVTVTTDKAGAAKRIGFHWWVHRCNRGRYRFEDRTLFVPSGDPVGHVRGGGPYKVKYRGGIHARIVARASGRRLSIYRWKGWFSATATLTRHGHVLDRCHFRRQRWLASTPKIRFDLSGDESDYIVHGLTLSYTTPDSHFYIETPEDRRGIVISASQKIRGYDYDYTLAIRTPNGRRRLTRGRYPAREYTTRRWAYIELSGDGRACSPGERGEFTIARAKYDRQGLVFVSGSFEQHCQYASGVARGTFSYHR